ncbi:DUF4192 domain-containing protein [Actinoplanes sp. L3-i22]|uniref:DUF4192 domain-containing protein n=1 Tax=Actinoplanes sp. L3-i22 TaxID=2836373 RepID=UPI001C74615B|nr:DUF4192 domain-containing protein [Actinoplanes sp. L3-i22]BCY08942.1 hypothetical protein L3i22_040300 [Actinoplanes sp. L3-i22]
MELRITKPQDAAAIIPYLLGYQPADSLAFVAVENHLVACTGCQPLPEGPDYRPLAHHLAQVLQLNNLTSVLLVGYGPRATMVDALEQSIEVFTEAGVTVLDAMRVGEGQVWHIGCGEPDCERHGEPFDPLSSVAAATATFAGLQVAPDREALAARLAPVTGAERHAMRTALAAARKAFKRPMPARTAAKMIKRLTAHAVVLADHDTRLPHDQAAHLLLLLSVPDVIESVLGLVHGTDQQVRVWTDLTRRAGAGRLACTPAMLLAVAALLTGDGVTATLAAERACQADPDDELAELLHRAIQNGLSPQALHRTLHG